jgi:fused signal recognition particle receptor
LQEPPFQGEECTMFGSLKKKLRESVDRLAGKAEAPGPGEAGEAAEEVAGQERLERPEEAEKAARTARRGRGAAGPGRGREADPRSPEHGRKPGTGQQGILSGFRERLATRELSDGDIDGFFRDAEPGLLQANVALEVVDFLRESLKRKLAGAQAGRLRAGEAVRQAFRESLLEVVRQDGPGMEEAIRKATDEGRPALFVFLGFNGSGKTTSIAKVAKHLMGKGHRPVLAAADTFRAASIEQLEHHGEKLGLKVVKHQYGADAAAVVFDAVKYAQAKGNDVVLADTAGRSHADRNLMDELSKVIRINRPDMRILVVDSLTGNDAVEQAQSFDRAAGADGVSGVVMTKADVNEKGGSILSVCYAIRKPVLFLGTGQGYGDLEEFVPERFVEELVG